MLPHDIAASGYCQHLYHIETLEELGLAALVASVEDSMILCLVISDY